MTNTGYKMSQAQYSLDQLKRAGRLEKIAC